MKNHLTLTDDELTAIQTALHATLMSIDQYEKEGKVLDYMTLEVKNDMEKLFKRFNEEYF